MSAGSDLTPLSPRRNRRGAVLRAPRPRPIITLLTDFGTSDTYVGEMKGVILGIAPHAAVVDLTHEVPPQAIAEGAFLLGRACRSFPPGTVHVAVVDPGVGTARRPILLVSPTYAFMGPDNGLFSHVLLDGHEGAHPEIRDGQARIPPGWRAYVLTERRLWRAEVSGTFHGRDIFAPVAAHLAAGMPPDQAGTAVEWVSYDPPPEPRREGDFVRGAVVYVDRFGDLVTCIPARMLPQGPVEVAVCGAIIHGLSKTYQDGLSGGVLALAGSHGTLEIVVRDGNAAQALGGGVGTEVTVRPARG